MSEINLETLSCIDINTIDRNAVKLSNSTGINTSLPIEERYRNMLREFENPYFFRCDETIVKVEFSDNDVSLQDILCDTLIRKKNRK